MGYEIFSSRQFESDFKRLDSSVKSRIKNKIKEVAECPERYKHMKYDFSGSCRIRIGKLRIIFSYDIEKQIIYLEKIVFSHKYD